MQGAITLKGVMQPLFSGSLIAGRGKGRSYILEKGHIELPSLVFSSPSQKCLNICPRVACTLTKYLP